MTQKITAEEARILLLKYYNITPVVINELDSYWDQNFYVKSKEGEFVFKRTWRDSEEVLDLQNKAIDFLYTRDFLVPHVQVSRGKKKIIKERDTFLRLLTFLPGKPLSSYTFSTDLLHNAGVFAAKVTHALQQFSHPAGRRETFIFDLQNSLLLRNYLGAIDDSEKVKLISSVLNQFEKEVLSRQQFLRRGIVHNDMHVFNLLSGDGKTISGLIDFGDICYTFYINDLAVILAHFMLQSTRPLRDAHYLFNSYTETFLITESEEKVLPLLVLTRLAAVITMCTDTLAKDPANRYVEQYIDSAWKLLQILCAKGSENILDEIKGNT